MSCSPNVFIILILGIFPAMTIGFFLGRAYQIREDMWRTLRSSEKK